MDPEELAELLDGDEREAEGPQALQGWALIALLAGMLSTGALLGAGAVLSEAGLGASRAARACDPVLGTGLLLLVFAGAVLGLIRIVVDRRYAQEVVFDHVRFWALLPVPVLLLAATAPAFLGCEFARTIVGVEGLGVVLTGTPGIALAGAAAFTAGLAMTLAVRLRTPVASIIEHYELVRAQEPSGPDRVEQALADDAQTPVPPDGPQESPGAHPVLKPPRE